MLPDKSTIPFFSILLTLLFFTLSLIGILHHELWLDEAHGFLIANASRSIGDLYHKTQQEGHPILWHFILWCLGKYSHNILYMQILHILISSVTVFLMSRYAPFNRYKKVLFAFSYYFFFEYNILSRNYGLCILFVTIYCILILKAHKNYYWIAITLAFLASTHFFGLILSITLAMTAFIQWWLEPGNTVKNMKQWIFPVCILLVSYAMCIEHIIPDKASVLTEYTRNGYFSFKRWSAFTVILKGLFQFPFIDGTSWNTNIFTQNKVVGLLLTLIVVLVSVKAFFNKPISFFVFFLTVISFSAFFYLELIYAYAVRHWGFVFLGFYVAIWLSEGMNQERYWTIIKSFFKVPAVLQTKHEFWREALLYSCLLVQVSASVYMFVWDYVHPFSNGKAVAAYIQSNHYENDLIIVSNFTSGPAIAMYLDKQLYYPEYHGYGTYADWSTFPAVISTEVLRDEIIKCRALGYDTAILVLNDEMYSEGMNVFELGDKTIQIEFLKFFDGGFNTQDHYKVYRIRYR